MKHFTLTLLALIALTSTVNAEDKSNLQENNGVKSNAEYSTNNNTIESKRVYDSFGNPIQIESATIPFTLKNQNEMKLLEEINKSRAEAQEQKQEEMAQKREENKQELIIILGISSVVLILGLMIYGRTEETTSTVEIYYD